MLEHEGGEQWDAEWVLNSLNLNSSCGDVCLCPSGDVSGAGETSESGLQSQAAPLPHLIPDSSQAEGK